LKDRPDWDGKLLDHRWVFFTYYFLPSTSVLTGVGGVHVKAFGYPTPPGAPGTSEATATNYQIRTAGQVNKPMICIQYCINIFNKLEWAAQMMQVISLGTIKLSFLFFFRRIFNVSMNKIFSIVTITMIVLVSIWTLGFFLTFLFACKGHFSAWWTSIAILRAQCIHTIEFNNGFALSDVIMDFMFLVIPVPIVCQ
jgi:hypothetical protein